MVLLNLLQGLRDRGHEVAGCAPTEGPLLERLRSMGIATHVIPLRHAWDWSSVRALARLLDEQGFDVVQSHGRIMNILTRRAVAWTRRRPLCIGTEHNPQRLAHGSNEPGWKAKFKARFYRWLDNTTARWSDMNICVSEAVRLDKVEQGVPEEKLVTIENGIDLPRFPPADPTSTARLRQTLDLPEDAPIVGTLARLDRQKNVGDMIRAMPTVWEAIPSAQLVIAGDGVEREALERLALELGGQGRVRFLGFRTDAVDLLHLYDIFCLSSRWEGLPISVLEAMACRRPVVATPVPGILAAVAEGETAWITPFGDPPAMGHALRGLLSDEAKRNAMGESGRHRLERLFTIDRMTERTEAIYRSLAHGSSRL